MTLHTTELGAGDVELLRQATDGYEQLRRQMGHVIIGQDRIVRPLLAAVFCQGHVLVVGVPGLAKTLMVKTLASVLGWQFKRIQFTPDMMPADIIGMELLQDDADTGTRRMRFVPGPIFANIILADEINRTPPKTQSALLEAMQEYTVTSMGHTNLIDRPFIVVATQNPIEQEGTYPLPEAQLDRFMFKIHVDYPEFDEELTIAERTTSQDLPKLEPVLSQPRILAAQQVVRKVLMARSVASYAVQLVRATRPGRDGAPDFINQYLTWGAGPRACQALLLGAKANALLDGRVHASTDDIRDVAKPVLRHRLVTSYTAESDSVTADHIVERLFEAVREE